MHFTGVYVYASYRSIHQLNHYLQWRGNHRVRGSNDLPEIYLWVKHGILTPTFFGKKYFLVHTYTFLLRLQVAYGRILHHSCKFTYVDMNLHHNYIIF